jgi:hypothetical protein
MGGEMESETLDPQEEQGGEGQPEEEGAPSEPVPSEETENPAEGGEEAPTG